MLTPEPTNGTIRSWATLRISEPGRRIGFYPRQMKICIEAGRRLKRIHKHLEGVATYGAVFTVGTNQPPRTSLQFPVFFQQPDTGAWWPMNGIVSSNFHQASAQCDSMWKQHLFLWEGETPADPLCFGKVLVCLERRQTRPDCVTGHSSQMPPLQHPAANRIQKD